jgi:hypothetical protein
MALALDGSAHNNSSASSTAVTLTTTQPNDIIAVLAISNAGVDASSVSGGGLTWNNRAILDTGTGVHIGYWWAVASTVLTSATITVTPFFGAYTTVDAFAVSGANTSSPFDGSVITNSVNPAAPLSINTTHANTFIFGHFEGGSLVAVAPLAKLSTSLPADFALVEYEIVSTTQTGLSVTVTVPGNANTGIADAILAAAAAGTQTLTPSLVAGDDAFFAPALSLSSFLLPALVSDADSFYAPSSSTSAALLPGLVADSDVVPAPVVGSGAASTVLQPQLVADNDNIYGAAVTYLPILRPAFFNDADLFYPTSLIGGLPVVKHALTGTITRPRLTGNLGSRRVLTGTLKRVG